MIGCDKLFVELFQKLQNIDQTLSLNSKKFFATQSLQLNSGNSIYPSCSFEELLFKL